MSCISALLLTWADALLKPKATLVVSTNFADNTVFRFHLVNELLKFARVFLYQLNQNRIIFADARDRANTHTDKFQWLHIRYENVKIFSLKKETRSKWQVVLEINRLKVTGIRRKNALKVTGRLRKKQW